MSIKTKKVTLIGILIILALGAFCGCQYTWELPDKPVMLIEAITSENTTSTEITNVKIEKTDGTEIIVAAGKLDVHHDNNCYRGGYTFYLEEGASYNKISWNRGGNPVEGILNITNAEAGIVYYVSIN